MFLQFLQNTNDYSIKQLYLQICFKYFILKKLNKMSLNKIFLIVGSFSNLPNLYKIDMDYTTLTDLPTGFAFQCNALRSIYVRHSLLETSGDCKN